MQIDFIVLQRQFKFREEFDLEYALNLVQRFHSNRSEPRKNRPASKQRSDARSQLKKVVSAAAKLKGALDSIGPEARQLLEVSARNHGLPEALLSEVVAFLADVPYKGLSQREANLKLPGGNWLSVMDAHFVAIDQHRGQSKEIPEDLLLNLAAIYEEGTGKRPTCNKSNNYSKKSNNATGASYAGPFFRFAREVLPNFGVTVPDRKLGKYLVNGLLKKYRTLPDRDSLYGGPATVRALLRQST